jgi:hypothetical protein
LETDRVISAEVIVSEDKILKPTNADNCWGGLFNASLE